MRLKPIYYYTIGMAISLFLGFCSPLLPHALVPMDSAQANHLKAYGAVYSLIQGGMKVKILLNYRGGSFLVENPESIPAEKKSLFQEVSLEAFTQEDYSGFLSRSEKTNMGSIELEKVPRVGVYKPPGTAPWDDAVVMALDYAGIPYTRIYDNEVLTNRLVDFDWLHLHHEDFTGQMGKFYATSRHELWYQKRKFAFESEAKNLGFSSVPELKNAVARKIAEFTFAGGYLFAMCSATDSLDIALASTGVDIVDPRIDGSPITPDFEKKLDFSRTLAFENFTLITDPEIYEFSDIDIDAVKEGILYKKDFFTLFEFNAKYDPIPALLTQNHERDIRGFLGQTNAFRRSTIKSRVIILGDTPGTNRVRYIYGKYGKGFFTFYAGHDPEDYAHYVGDPNTNLELFRNSPGYRIILNNIFLPSARKQERKT